MRQWTALVGLLSGTLLSCHALLPHAPRDENANLLPGREMDAPEFGLDSRVAGNEAESSPESQAVADASADPNPFALSFDGKGAYADLGESLYASSPMQLTVEAWINARSIPAIGQQGVVLYNGRNGEWQIQVTHDALRGGPKLAYSGWRLAEVNIAQLQVGAWHHVAMTWGRDAEQVKLFVDGQEQGSLATPPESLAHPFGSYRPTIGAYQEHHVTRYDYYFDGLIDEVRVWNVVRTQIQLQASMFRHLQGNENGLIGYWPLEAGTGEKVVDRSLSGHDGTIASATWTIETPF